METYVKTIFEVKGVMGKSALATATTKIKLNFLIRRSKCEFAK